MNNLNIEIDFNQLDQLIELALKEDIGNGDLTTNLLVPEFLNSKAYMKSKAEGVIAGLKVAERVFKKLDNNIKWNQKFSDGDKIKPGDILVDFEGSYKAILTGERTALNFLQRMSGIATATSKFVEAVKHTKTKILDTRKTVPGLRMLDKYSVKMGGGKNHRIGLYDMVLIKENHIRIAGSIKDAVRQIRSRLKPGIKIEVETTNLSEVKEALNSNADVIMLDNMDTEIIRQAVKVIGGRALTEASGNINMDNVKKVAETGVDFISIGAITHSVTTLDIALYVSM